MPYVFVGGIQKRVQGVFYGWWIVASSFAIQALSSGLLFSGFGIYFLPLKTEFGWSRTLLSLGYSVNRVESAVLGPIQGWAMDRFGPRIMLVVGTLIFGAGFIVFSQIQSILGFFVAFFMLAIGSSLGGFLPITATITNWFARKRALAIGIAMTGMGLGGVLVPLLAWSITTYGWRKSAFASAFLVWLIGIPAALVLRHKPEPYGYLPDGVRAPQPARVTAAARDMPSDYSFTAREALRTPAFWLISFGHAFALLVVSAVGVHQVPHMVNRVGLSLQGAASVVTLMLAMSVVGQLGGGHLADRINKRIILVICMLGHTAGLLVLAYATTYLQLVLFAIVHGLSWGARGPTQQAIRADYFGRSSYATIIGFSSLVVGLGTIIGPIFAGWLADVRGGSYTLPFTILAILTGFGSLFFLFARQPVPKSRPSL